MKLDFEHQQKKQEVSFKQKLEEFLERHKLSLDVPQRKPSLKEMRDSQKKEVVEDYVVVRDFPLNPEGSVSLSYKESDDAVFAMKEMSQKNFTELKSLHNWGDENIEEYLENKKFYNQNILLPKKRISANGKVYRFYELMDMDLEKYLESHNQLSVEDSISLILRACESIEALHQAGVIYVDFAPLNTMLTSTQIKLADLDGAAIDRNNDGVMQRTYNRSNRFISAPELFTENPNFNKTVDIYAAAANLYRLIAGHWPYDIEKGLEGISAKEKRNVYKKLHFEGKILFPTSIPKKIKEVIQKAMSQEPKDRYQTMEEFMDALMNAVEK